MKKSIGILGGGISAVSLAYFLPRNKYTVTILEKEREIGGLARSFNKEGFIFDVGPHIIFAKDKKILRWMCAMLGPGDRKLFRNNSIYYKGRFVKYPFENELSALPPEDNYECLYHFLNNPFTKEPAHFADWIYGTFGKGIAERYLIPYNTKIWKTHPSNLSLEWIGGRVPKPPAEDIIKSSLGIKTEGYTHQLYFHYPIRGGIYTLVTNILKKVKARRDLEARVITECEVRSIERAKGRWLVTDTGGRTYEFDVLVNTMPIHVLGKTARFLDAPTKNAITKLVYNSLVLVYLGLSAPKRTDRFAVYFPQHEYLFHRISFNDYLSPHLSPKGKSSITAEITYRPGDAISQMSDKQVIQHVVGALHKEKLIDRRKLVLADAVRMTYEYPVYELGAAHMAGRVFKKLDSIENFYYCGRFAEFRYINMNDCIKSAMQVARRL